MGTKTFIIDMGRYPGVPDFLSKLPGFFKVAGADAWGIEWSRYYPWTVGSRFGSFYKYPEECIQGLRRRSRDEGISFLPVIDPQILSDIVLECGLFDHMSISPGDSLVPKLDPGAVGSRQLLDEILEDLFSLYTDGNPLVLRRPLEMGEAEATRGIAEYIEKQFGVEVRLLRPGDTGIQFIGASRQPWVRTLHRIEGAEKARGTSVFDVSRKADDLLERIEVIAEAAWEGVRRIREILAELQERTSPSADLREGESTLKELHGALERIGELFEEAETKTRGVLEVSPLRSMRKVFVFPLEEERALVEARLKQFAPWRRKKKS